MSDEPQQTQLKVVKDEPKAISLPSGNIAHSEVFRYELENRLHGFRSGIIALQGEQEGQQGHYEASVKELTDKHNTATSDLLRRIGDLQKAERAVTSALDSLDRAE